MTKRRQQRIDFYGETSHDHPGVRGFFATDQFFDRMDKDKKKHLALEHPWPLQKTTVEPLWNTQISRQEYIRQFEEYHRKLIEPSGASEETKQKARELVTAYASTTADIIAKASTRGIQVHFVDHADKAAGDGAFRDPVVKCYMRKGISTKTEEEMQSLTDRERVAHDPDVAKRVLNAFGGEDGDIAYGLGHGEHRNGIPQSLRKLGIKSEVLPVFYDKAQIEAHVKEFKESAAAKEGLSLNHSGATRAVDAQTGKDIPVPAEMRAASEKTKNLENKWQYNPACP